MGYTQKDRPIPDMITIKTEKLLEVIEEEVINCIRYYCPEYRNGARHVAEPVCLGVLDQLYTMVAPQKASEDGEQAAEPDKGLPRNKCCTFQGNDLTLGVWTSKLSERSMKPWLRC